ncbi:phage tail tube protein [Massilia alkalitolerans]|uniref:phage tail tube protein n=1 Tax=Massilia alkalitolerans TaxID=286638 RepID=UPI00041ACFF3|nr:phage tail tube protein [Massilia alkalitolerans]
MPRSIKNTIVTAKVETTTGVDAAPTGAANAVLVSDVSITPLESQAIGRNLVRGYFGGSEQLVGPGSVKISYTVELAGSGTAGTAPAWGQLLQGCAVAEGVLATPARVEYQPVSTSLKSLTQYYYDDGVLHKLLASMGNCTLSAKVGDRPVLRFEWTGLDGGIAAVPNVAPTFTPWKKPVAMTKANVVDITLGATYAAGALTGGTVYNSTGLELNFGNVVNFTPMLGTETVDITDRESTATIELELTAEQEVALMAAVKANTTQSLALTIGTVAGNKIIVFAPAAQLTNPKKSELNGKRLIGYDVRLVPVSGNDEWRIVTQ